MDDDDLKKALDAAVPFGRLIGLQYQDIGDGAATVGLPERQELHNHIGSQHAAALYAVAEAASGAAFAGAFARRLTNALPLVRSSEFQYRRVAHGPISATCQIDQDVSELISVLEEAGRVEFPLDVSLTDAQGEVVATGRFLWHVRRAG